MHIFRGKIDWGYYAKNEGMTLIFPRSINLNETAILTWQWTELDNGNTKELTVQYGKITELSNYNSKLYINIKSEDYTFEVILDNNQSALLTMKNPKGEASKQESLTLSYHSENNSSESDIYAGKLNWTGYADNQTIIVIAPEKLSVGAPILTYWQWDDKTSSDHLGTIDVFHENTDSEGARIEFYNEGYYYTFSGVVNNEQLSPENHDVIAQGIMRLKMKNPQGYESPDINLELIWSNNTSAALSRKKRWLTGTNKTTIINDTGNIYHCTLADNESEFLAIRDGALTIIGAATAFVGVCTIGATGGAAIVGGAATVIGGIAALPGTLELSKNFWEDRPSRSKILMPRDGIYRESNIEITGPAPRNQLTITELLIENENEIVVRKGTSEPLDGDDDDDDGDGENNYYHLIMKDKALLLTKKGKNDQKINWEDPPLLKLRLNNTGNTPKIEPRALVYFKGFVPKEGGKNFEEGITKNMSDKENGFMFSFESDNFNPLQYGILGDNNKPTFMFGNGQENKNFVCILSATSDKLISINTKDPSKRAFFLKLTGYSVINVNRSRVLDYAAGSDKNVLYLIRKDIVTSDDNTPIYSVSGKTGPVIAESGMDFSVQPSRRSDDEVYIRVNHIEPFQKLQLN